jgi:hypothetical protein
LYLVANPSGVRPAGEPKCLDLNTPVLILPEQL